MLCCASLVAAQVEQKPGIDAELGEGYQFGERQPLQFTLESAEYALGWTKHVRYGTPNAEQKMLILHFRVQNAGEENLDFSYRNLDFYAVDNLAETHERENPIAVYVRGTEDDLDQTLLPAQAVDAYTAIMVPAERSIPKLIVEHREDEALVLRYDLQGKIEPLPPTLRGEGQETVKTPLQGRLGFFYPTGAYDVRISDVETRTDPEIAGWTLKDEMKWVILTLDVRSRFEEDLPVTYQMFRSSMLIDDFGDEYENIRALHSRRDTEYRGEVAPGEIETFRLLYSIYDDAEPEALLLKARTPGGEEGLGTLVAFTNTPNPEDAAQGQLLGDSTASTFAAGIYDPLERTVPVAEVEVPELIVSPGEVLIPDEPEDEGAADETSDDSTDEASGVNDDMAQYVRDASFRVNSLEALEVQESSGDEPYFLQFTFSGVLGDSNAAWSLGVLEDKPLRTGGANWLDSRRTYSLGDRHLYEWYDLKPYEIYGVVLLVMEDDSSEAGEIEDYAGRVFGYLKERWKQTIEMADAPDVSDDTTETQRRYAQACQRVVERFHGGPEGVQPIRTLAADIGEDEFSGDFEDDDDFMDALVMVWVNMPTDAAKGVLSGYQNFYRPGEHTQTINDYSPALGGLTEFYRFRFENRLGD